jgi:DNA-directed RNA polymerase specialized sigma24 family protein
VTRATAIGIERRNARRRDRTNSGVDASRIDRSQATLSQAFDRAWARMIGREAGRLVAERAAGHAGGTERVRCLEMRYVRGLPPRDIAQELACPVERVYELLKQARVDYRAALLEVVGSYLPGASERELEEKCRELAEFL